MRYILAFFILIIGIGATGFSLMDSGNQANESNVVWASAGDRGNGAADSVLTQVDRDDDPAELLPCTPAPNDCTLRSALAVANSDNEPTTITFADHYLITLNAPLPGLSERGTKIRALAGQDVHVNGNYLPGTVFYVTGPKVHIEGLYIYGAGAGYANITVGGSAYDVTIANNVIGDDDAPAGNCGQNALAYAGIFVGAVAEDDSVAHALIYGNIIECHTGAPGAGILLATDRVIIGHDGAGCQAAAGNHIRQNHGFGIDLGEHTGNVVCNNIAQDNMAGSLAMSNYNNDVLRNDVQ